MHLSDDTTTLIRFLARDDEHAMELPDEMIGAFDGDAEACEAAQKEAVQHDLIELGPELTKITGVDHYVRHAKLTIAGRRYALKLSS